jgi:hypothetical protein
MTRTLSTALLLIATVALPGTGRAQDPSFADWTNTIALYGFATSLDGDSQVGDTENPVDVSFDQVLDSLETALMARYRGQGGRWAFVVDSIFAGLGGTREGTFGKQDVDLDLLVVQSDAAYRFSETSEVLFGVRYVRFESQVDVSGALGGAARFENDASFFDPVVGLRTNRKLGEKMRLQAQGDIGGGVDMDLTWQAMLHLGYQPNPGLSFWLGYRALGLDFDDSGERNRFSADFVMHGPVLGAAFHF